MTERKPKTLVDFPRFTVASMRKELPDAQGNTDFELEGRFDRMIPRGEATWFWLLFGSGSSLCVQWKSQDDQTLAAVLTGCQERVPDLVGATLYYLSPSWQAYHVWMVLDVQWGWQRARFTAGDAVASGVESATTSIVGDRQVTKWTKLEKAGGKGHAFRCYPATDEASVTHSGSQVVPGGWDHEHCELCNTSVNPGDLAYRDPDERWMCEACYEKYIRPHDLSFVDDL